MHRTLKLTITAMVLLWQSCVAHADVTVTTVTFTGPDSVTLSGVLYRPDSYAQEDGFPAVVMLHGCSGMWSGGNPAAANGNGTPNLQNQIEKWGLKLAEEGMVALAVDSFTPRKPDGIDPVEWQDHCSGSLHADTIDSYTTRVLDSRAAQAFLATDSKIDTDHIAQLGWSHGAQAAVVESAETGKDADVARALGDHLFATTVVYYPGCGSSLGFGGVAGSFYRPHRDLMMHVGTSDSFHANCQSRANRAVSVHGAGSGSGREMIFQSHDSAAHSFDGVSQTWPAAYCATVPPSGNECAMAAADIDSLAFLKARLFVSSVQDNDRDGVDDSTDLDDDNDTLPDVWELANGHDPLRADYMVSAGGFHSCALDNTGVKCWGGKSHGQTAVPSLIEPSFVSAGHRHSCAIDVEGVKCWGAGVTNTGTRNNFGQSIVPPLTNPTTVSAGYWHTCAIDATGVHCWGRNDFGQTTVPPDLVNPVMVSAGRYISCALHDNGVKCWGKSGIPQTKLPVLNAPLSLSVGDAHSCALDSTGVKCWGRNTAGQISVPALTSPQQVAAGKQHTCVLDAGNVLCWGRNPMGQTDVPPLVNPAALDAGMYHSCALDSAGVKCWGRNNPKFMKVPPLDITHP